MTALYIYRRRVAFHASGPRRPANDAHCVTVWQANDNDGGRAA